MLHCIDEGYQDWVSDKPVAVDFKSTGNVVCGCSGTCLDCKGKGYHNITDRKFNYTQWVLGGGEAYVPR